MVGRQRISKKLTEEEIQQHFETEKCEGIRVTNIKSGITHWFCCCGLTLQDLFDTTFFVGAEEE